MGTRVGFLVVLFTFFSPGKAEFHFTDDDWRSYVKGPEDVSDYDIIEPGVVHHERTKRGSELQFASSVNFTAFGDYFHIDLLQSETFFDPDLKVKVYGEDGSFEEQPLTVSPDCFYHGFLPTHNFSTATVSICDGKIHGYIDDGVHGIFITPLIEKHSNEYSRRRRTPHSGHLIYKRTTPEEGERFCPVEREGFDAGNSPQTSEQLFVPPKYLEVAVLLDVTFQADRQPDPAGYAMALMHVASRRFAEPTLDVTLQIIIVELIFLPSDSGMVRGSQLDIVADGLTTLNSLILWNQGASGTDGTPGHWDNVVLISGKDLTSTTSGSDLLGIASTIGTCVSGQGTSVNEDTGLSAGLTIAHEMGHTMTLLHDDTYGCDPGYVMSAFAGADPNNFLWTSCSSINLKTFLSGAGADCMDNIPPFIPPLSAFVLPGAMYDLTEQCKLFLGDDAFGCPVDGVVDCSVLRCDTGGSGCSPDGLRVTAEGTPCDVDMICLAGSCIDSTSVPQPVDGSWGDWSEYSPCSRTCDCGVTTRERICNNPSPVYSGEFCEGENSEITTCDTEVSCGNTPDDHRDEQCAASNDMEYEGQTYDWVNNINSGLDESLFCVNLCQATGLDFALSRSPFVNEDGTDCWNLDRLDWDRIFKCFSGSCRDFGCDGVEGSSIGYDACRICNGDESSCTRVANTYNAGNLNQFNRVATIPAGATSVYINNEDLAIGNHVAIVGEISDFEYFGGSGPTPSTNERARQGTMTIVHEFNAILETFFTPGPTTEGLNIDYYRSGPGELEYEYYTRNPGVSYFWYLGEFSDCSASCGAGTVYRVVSCYEVNLGVQREVAESDCLTNGLDPSPPTQEECNLGDCPPEWVAGSFGDCDSDCGLGTRTRTVECQEEGVMVVESMCTAGTKPDSQEECDQGDCLWAGGAFGGCSATCDGGMEERTFECRNMNGAGMILSDDNCPSTKPVESRPCNQGVPCGGWVIITGECNTPCGTGLMEKTVECQIDGAMVLESMCTRTKPAVPDATECDQGQCVWDEGEYGECDQVCGGGTQVRSVECKNMGGAGTIVPDDNCLPPKPEELQLCNVQECGVAIWVASPFGECSEECGGGTQTRTVTCKLDGQITDGAACLGEKPELQQACNEPPCEGEECHESVRSTSGRIRRTADTAGEICIITLIADLGSGFQFSNQGSSLTGSDFFKIINRGAMSQSFRGVASPTANNVVQVEYRLSGTGSFQFSYSVTVVMPPAECDEFVDATDVAGTITGEFTSPGFRKNDKYGPNLRCWQRLLVDTDRLVTLQFNRFRLQTGRHGKNRSCQYDHLEVRNLVTGETVKLCGTKRPFCLNVDYDTVLYFKTNWRRGFKGYLVKYTTT